MSDEYRDNAEPKKLSLAKKVWLGFLIFCYLLFCSILILFVTSFNQEQDHTVIFVLQLPVTQIAVVLMLLGCLFSVVFCVKRIAGRLPKENRYRKFGTGIALLSFMGSLLLIIYILQSGHAHRRTPDRDTKSNLHYFYLACKDYWADKGSDKNCTVDIASLTTYAYIQSVDVSVSGGGTETTFAAEGRHVKSPRIYAIDYLGEISEIDK